MIQSRSKVTHPEHGRGQVVKVNPHSATCKVVFGMITRTVLLNDLKHSGNSYHSSTTNKLKKWVSSQMEGLGNTPQSEGARIMLEKLKNDFEL